MQLTIHNSQSGRKETFTPADPARVLMYVCGPTVYGYVHIGNGRPAVVFDVLFRVLNTLYPEVVFARNITDVEDKINAAARAAGESIQAFSQRFTDAYSKDVGALGVLPPTVQPHATAHIAEMIEIIEVLIERGHAYAADGHALFHVPSDPNYGSLSHRSLEDMIDGARVEVAPYKKDPKDFVLWKPSEDGVPGWDSPWGFGRPGWHIECTAMIHKHLGRTIDIHGGGSDLRFPHHENELAQGTCAYDDEPFVKYWMHNGMINFGTEKMSKSLGNILTIRDLLADHHGEVLRYALISGQYRSTLTWTDDLIAQSRASLERLYQALVASGQSNQTSLDYAGASVEQFPASVLAALCDDLNTPLALSEMHAIATRMNRSQDRGEQSELRRQLLAAGWLTGLLAQSPESFFQHGAEVDQAQVAALVAERENARKTRDFARADELRDQLTGMGVELEDTPEGTRWKLAQD